MTSYARPEISLVICTLDEAEAIGPVLDEARQALSGIYFEIIVVDDSAGEDTADAVRSRSVGDARIRLIRRSGPRGLASAAIKGWEVARGHVFGIMDGDGQHDPSLLRSMLDQVRSGADFAVASRFAPSASLGLTGVRRMLSNGGTALINAVLGARTTDPLSGFFLMTRGWFEVVRPRLTGVGFKILVDLLAAGARRPRVEEVSTSLRPRIGGHSKLDLRVLIELLAQILEHKSGGAIKARFALFAGVGISGMAIHATALTLLQNGKSFALAQAGAILMAMVWNYCLNNLLAFRDLRLRGPAFWRGMAVFILACSGGAVISQLTALGLAGLGIYWFAAGLSGAVVGAFWNYASGSRAVWGIGNSTNVPAAIMDGAAHIDPALLEAAPTRSASRSH